MGFIEFTDKAQKEAIFAKKEDYEMEGRQLYLDTLDGNNRGGGRGGARGGARGGRGASRGAGPRGCEFLLYVCQLSLVPFLFLNS